MHKLTGKVITTFMEYDWLMTTLNILLPIAVFFEAGIVSAIVTFFGYFIVMSLAMNLKRDAAKEKMMEEVMKSMKNKKGGSGGIEDLITSVLGEEIGETTEFETDDYKGKVTAINMDNLPPEIRSIIDKIAGDKDDDDENTTNVTKH